MADIELVIKIPEEVYKSIINGKNYISYQKYVEEAIKNGTPLPKGHGELIDRGQALNECYRITVDGDVFEVVQYETLLGVPTIIEADKERDND